MKGGVQPTARKEELFTVHSQFPDAFCRTSISISWVTVGSVGVIAYQGTARAMSSYEEERVSICGLIYGKGDSKTGCIHCRSL